MVIYLALKLSMAIAIDDLFFIMQPTGSTTNSHLQPPAATCSHLQPPAATWPLGPFQTCSRQSCLVELKTPTKRSSLQKVSKKSPKTSKFDDFTQHLGKINSCLSNM
jgi:hypothetical protein